MRADSIVFAIAGMCFGVILGWVIGVQQAGGRFTAPSAATSTATPQGSGAGQPQPPPLDEARVQSLMTVIKNDPGNAGAAVQLANTYFDAERFPEAIKWYEESLRIDPSNPDASTDLGVSFYYTGQTDRALQQFTRSLELNPKHTKTLLNQGIVLAFGKQDLAGAQASWKQVVELAPGSPEAQAAQRALEGITAAGHGGTPPTPAVDAGVPVIRFLLLALLFILVARAVWRIVDGILEASRGAPAGRRGNVSAVKLVRDPVCGTYVPPRAALSVTAAGSTHYFCSEACLKQYQGHG